MTAALEAGKLALSFIPNVEVVSFFIIVFTLFLGPKVIFAITAFNIIEGLLYGFGVWFIAYLYIWPLLALLTILLKKHASAVNYAIMSGAFGLAFGALCEIPYLLFGGVTTALTWWIAGIPYDIIHCVANFVICLTLFSPITKALTYIKNRLEQ